MFEVKKGNCYLMSNGMPTGRVGKMTFSFGDVFFYTQIGCDRLFIHGSSETPSEFRIVSLTNLSHINFETNFRAGKRYLLKSGAVTSTLYNNEQPITKHQYPFVCYINDQLSYLPEKGTALPYPVFSCRVTKNIGECHKEIVKRLPFGAPRQYTVHASELPDSSGDVYMKRLFCKGIQKGNISFVHSHDPDIDLAIDNAMFNRAYFTTSVQRPVNEKSPITNEKHIRRFKSGAVRSDDRGRIRPDFISPYAMESIASHFTGAEDDFGSNSDSTNYFKGIPVADILPSIQRHTLDIHKELIGESDLDKLESEFSAIASNAIMALHTIALIKKGEYKEVYEKTEYIKQSDHDKTK